MQNNTKERTSKPFDYLLIARKIYLISLFSIGETLQSSILKCISHRWFSSLIEKWIVINCFHCLCLGFFKWKFPSAPNFLRRIVQKSRNDYITLNASRNVISGAPHTHTHILTHSLRTQPDRRRLRYSQCPLSYIHQNYGETETHRVGFSTVPHVVRFTRWIVPATVTKFLDFLFETQTNNDNKLFIKFKWNWRREERHPTSNFHEFFFLNKQKWKWIWFCDNV